MTHDARLTRMLRRLLRGQRSAALGTWPLLGDAGAAHGLPPALSFVPFAVDAARGTLVLHVSALAAHTRQMQARPAVSLLVAAPEVAGQPVHALQRVAIHGQATLLAPADAGSARAAYLARFPEAEPMTQLGDFRFAAIAPAGGRHVAGFGAARDVTGDELLHILRSIDTADDADAPGAAGTDA